MGNTNKTSLEKIEKFLLKTCKEELYRTLENYPEERSIVLDYTDLIDYDQDLADLLLRRPTECLMAFQRTIKNIDPLMKDAELNVRFKNLTNFIPMNKLNSRHMDEFLVTRGIIKNISDIHPRIINATFECRGCMRLVEIDQPSSKTLLELSLCPECGSRSFRLLQEDSEYVDIRNATLVETATNDSPRFEAKQLKIIYEDDLVNKLRNNDVVNLIGTLKSYKAGKDGKFINYLYVNNIEFVKKWGENLTGDYEIEFSDDIRNTPEYNEWRNKVIIRDKETCQCCGLNKHLEAHHIYGLEEHKELALDVGNGITLCQFCHKKYHSVHGVIDITPEKFAKFMRRHSVG